MADVFISYARDDQPFVRTLAAALEVRQRDAWVDWEGIPPTAEWWAEIRAAIDAADTFVFVMSPDALASQVCALELDHAVQHNKRLVPVVRREAGGQAVPEALARLNWIFMRENDDIDTAVGTLIEALDTDLAHVKLHTHYLQRAIAWQHQGEDTSMALRGRDLAAAEAWLAASGDKAPPPTSLHNRFILDSRRASTRRQRQVGGAIGVAVLVATVLGLIALQQREAKRVNQQRAVANQLIGESRLALDERDDGLADSVRLAADGMRRLADLGERSLAADQALRRGLALLPAPPTVVPLAAEGEIRAAGFGAGGDRLVFATSIGQVVLMDLDDGRTVGAWTLPPETGATVRAVAVDPGGTRVALWRYRSGAGRSRLSLWDPARGVELAGCDIDGDFKGSEATLGPQGWLWLDRAVWRLETCRTWDLWDARTLVGALALSGGGDRLAASVHQRGDRQHWIELRDARTGVEIDRWRHDDPSLRLAWLAGDRQLAAVDPLGRGVAVWQVASPGRPRALRLPEPVVAFADGRAATAATDSAVARVRRLADGAELLRLVHPAPVRAAAFSADGRTLRSLVGRQLWQWTLAPAAASMPLDAAASRRLLARSGHRPADLLPDAMATTLQQGGQTVLAATPCPDADTLAVTLGTILRAGWQARTEVWAVADARRLASFDLLQSLGVGMRGLDDRSAGLLACSGDARLLALPARDAVVVRELAGSGRSVRLPHPGVYATAFTPDGAHLATLGRGPVRVWDIATGTEVARLLDDTPVDGLVFSGDGRGLAIRAGDRIEVGPWQPRDMIRQACDRLPGPLPADTWQRLFPATAYRDPCATP